jgi:putative acetyltransferase
MLIRELRPDETKVFLEVHHAAVRMIAASDYPSAVIESWAPLPITDAVVERVRRNPEGEIRLAAVLDGQVVGVGALIPQKYELRACYVSPAAQRIGVGLAIVKTIERIALSHELPHLELDSSITAEPFYLRLGYRITRRGQHILHSGTPMNCVMMRKDF